MPNGVNPHKWTPEGEGREFQLSPTLEPLADRLSDGEVEVLFSELGLPAPDVVLSAAGVASAIGDTVDELTDLPPKVVDLAEAWQAMTGLPFVFALWVVRAGVDLGDLPEALARSRAEGLAHADELAAAHGPGLGLGHVDRQGLEGGAGLGRRGLRIRLGARGRHQEQEREHSQAKAGGHRRTSVTQATHGGERSTRRASWRNMS